MGVQAWNSVPVPARVAERAYTRVEKTDDGCWISTYSVASHGYAQIGWQDGGRAQMVLAHRAAWVHVNGQMPLGMTLDHTCKIRACVNPDHLRVLSNEDNARRIGGRDWPLGECANGHPDSERVPRDGGGTICGPCRKTYIARNNWRTRHPNERLPERLLLAHDKAAYTGEDRIIMITENQPVFIGEADDTNEFGVRIQTGSTDMHVQPGTAIEFGNAIIAAARRAIANDQEEARERAEAASVPHAFDVEPRLVPLASNAAAVAINRHATQHGAGGDAA